VTVVGSLHFAYTLALARSVNSLAIFYIDGTLTDTSAVDDACYRSAVAAAIGVPEAEIDWSGTAHFTDRGIFDWLCHVHGRGMPSHDDITVARDRVTELLAAAMATSPGEFLPIAGAPTVFAHLAKHGWRISIATGCWGPSARLKLRAAGIDVPDALIACADDAAARSDIVELSRERAAAFYRCEFSRIVSIGDGTWDVETAVALQLPFVGVGRGERAARLERAGAGVVIEDYSNLSAFTDALEHAAVPRDARVR
jgi:phosphoglycolate phosphatase-like HAD superfamily hydrolase